MHTRLPKRFDDSVVVESTGSRECQSTSECMVNVYLPVMDRFHLELKKRFTIRNMKIMNAIQLVILTQTSTHLDRMDEGRVQWK